MLKTSLRYMTVLVPLLPKRSQTTYSIASNEGRAVERTVLSRLAPLLHLFTHKELDEVTT